MSRLETGEGDSLGGKDPSGQKKPSSPRTDRERRSALCRIALARGHRGSQQPDITEVVLSPEEQIEDRRKRIVQIIISANNSAEHRKKDHEIRYADISYERKIKLLRQWHGMGLPWLHKRLGDIIDELEKIDREDFEKLFLVCSLGNY